MKMCFNEEASWISLGVTTAVNVISMIIIRDPRYLMVALLWQWVILMQLSEGLAYRGRTTKNKWLNAFSAQMAMIANISQPLILAILGIMCNGNDISQWCLLLAVAATIFYSIYLVVVMWKAPSYLVLRKSCDTQDCSMCERGECHSNYIEEAINGFMQYFFHEEEGEEDCGHFFYQWWEDMAWNAGPYIVALGILILCLIRPISYMIYQFIIIFALLLVSCIWFKTGVGSVWCFFASFTPILNAIMWKILVKSV